MITYLKAKQDLDHIVRFNNAVMALWDIEIAAKENMSSYGYRLPRERKEAVLAEASKDKNYQTAREEVSKLVLKAMRIAAKHRIPTEMKSIPPPAVGGAIIPVNLFYSVLNDNSYQGISEQMIVDALTQTIGACESSIEEEFWKLLNPLNWIKELLRWILRIPFMLIELTGFNVEKVEDHLLGKLFKVIEVVAIVYILYRLGVQREGLAVFVKDFFSGGK